MTTINVYLTFNGDCEEAFHFYKSVFGGDFAYIGRFDEIPESEDYEVPESDKKKIMHVALPVGDTILMGSDVGESWAHTLVKGTNYAVSINTHSQEEADRLFDGLSAGGHITMDMQKTFWATYFGMFTDKFGINWMINVD